MLSIGEVADRSGIAPSAIRYWERERLIPKGVQTEAGRVYDEEVLDRLALIATAKAAGLSVAELRVLLAGIDDERARGRRWHDLVRRKRADLEQRRAQVDRMARVLQTLASSEATSLAECVREVLD